MFNRASLSSALLNGVKPSPPPSASSLAMEWMSEAPEHEVYLVLGFSAATKVIANRPIRSEQDFFRVKGLGRRTLRSVLNRDEILRHEYDRLETREARREERREQKRIRAEWLRVHAGELSVWKGMHNRCRCQSNSAWTSYGGRGIRVCERWNSFQLFLSDIGPRPSPKHSIDRVNNNGHYEPSNVRWATAKEQAHNTRRIHFARLRHGRFGAEILTSLHVPA